jgi:polysaccharide deacetylase family protein (PEP-CTERM system associated)
VSTAFGLGALSCETPPHSEPPCAHSLNCLSIDVEEYFHCEAFARFVSTEEWARLPRRALAGLERIAALLAEHQSRATFFVLGGTVPYLRSFLRQVVQQGHEIACHGDGHVHLRRMTPDQLRSDVRRARQRIEDALGVSPRGYRAPTFSVTRATWWALDVLLDEGMDYDASVFPIRHDRYGVPEAPIEPFQARTLSGRFICEFPPLTVQLVRMRLPVGGGGYLRLLPGFVLRRCIAARQSQRRPVMVYVHPWELDPAQPRLPAPFWTQCRHRLNLHTTEAKLAALLRTFRFERADAVLQLWSQQHELPTFGPPAPARSWVFQPGCPARAQVSSAVTTSNSK